MNKPNKKELNYTKSDFVSSNKDALYGYNQAIDEYESFLPNENEILEIVQENVINGDVINLTKEISKRLRGKN